MKVIREITEDEMIATFLSGELESERFGDRVHLAVEKYHVPLRTITSPDLASEHDNQLRRKMLRETRGYGSGESWFSGWPETINWYRAELKRDELSNVRYIVYNYWIELTGGTLRAGDAVQTIRAGTEIFDVSNRPLIDLSKKIKGGVQLPAMIIVGTNENDLVVLEGHVRLTAYLLAGADAPTSLEVIAGISPEFTHWKMYSFDAYNKYRQ